MSPWRNLDAPRALLIIVLFVCTLWLIAQLLQLLLIS